MQRVSLVFAAALSLLAVGAAGASTAATPAAAGTAILDGRAFGASLHLEARGGRRVEAALRRALDAVHELEAASDPGRGALAALNAGAGGGPQKAPAPLLAELRRALAFCRWSDGAQGPLGGALYELWGLRAARASIPGGEALEAASAAAACDHLSVDVDKGTLTLAAGARLDLWGFAAGGALDRAVEVLAEQGVGNASLTLGNVQRAVGDGPGGRGWPLRVEVPPSLAMLTANLLLHRQAFALASRDDGALRAGGETHPPYLDLRQGQPVAGMVATVAISELALDAQGLATTIFVTGTRRGSLLLGQLQPTPAALWALGDGTGEPLVSDYHWAGRRHPGGG